MTRQLDRREQILAEAEFRRTVVSVQPHQPLASPVRAMDLEELQRFAVFLAALKVSAAYPNDLACSVETRHALIASNRPVVAPAAAVDNRTMDTTTAVVNHPVEDPYGARGTRN